MRQEFSNAHNTVNLKHLAIQILTVSLIPYLTKNYELDAVLLFAFSASNFATSETIKRRDKLRI